MLYQFKIASSALIWIPFWGQLKVSNLYYEPVCPSEGYAEVDPLFGCGGLRFTRQVIAAGKRYQNARLEKTFLDPPLIGASANRSQLTIKRASHFVPILCPYNRPNQGVNHTKRKSHSLFTSSRTRCLGTALRESCPDNQIMLTTKVTRVACGKRENA
jgi:hypothetical protein